MLERPLNGPRRVDADGLRMPRNVPESFGALRRAPQATRMLRGAQESSLKRPKTLLEKSESPAGERQRASESSSK
eukprot:2426419-Alexandrium_andersonii.AAC.1